MPQLSIRQSLNKAFLKAKPNRQQIEIFKRNLIHLADNVNENQGEEYHKGLVVEFLKNTYYSPDYFINTKDRKDQVIHKGKSAKSPVAVIIEAKSPGNKAEMLSAARLNCKALQEILLYYLRERISDGNLEVKNLVVTNLHEWFVFDSQQFEKHFAQNKKLVKSFRDFEDGRLSGSKTEFFYKEIASPAIAAVEEQLEYTWFDLRKFFKPLKNADKADDKKLIPLYKVFSPEHLLKLAFANDSNSLNRSFYAELLHIIGLREEKDKGKKIIDRLPEGKRQPASLLENTITKLEARDYLSRLEKRKQFGETYHEQLFNVALELVITWVNRVLFLKLLEAQLLSYHGGEKKYTFLTPELLENYDDLDALFTQVLAARLEDRKGQIAKKFQHVPYLNSSLFEDTQIEKDTILVSNLQDDLQLPLHGSTVLKDNKGKRLKGEKITLNYLLSFLNAYDFSSEGGEEIQEENKSLINASVLGLIFEKINGYKDGSFFTPGFITMYMCRETIRRAVVQKFNGALSSAAVHRADTAYAGGGAEERGGVGSSPSGGGFQNFSDLYNAIGSQFTRNQANQIINSLKICDPAVGSGHFLVSALNEIIAIKSELNVLQDKNGKTLRDYDISIENDELIITDENGDFFEYHPHSKESQRVQETLFHEKQTIIENCLFGVDINPNSVKICRLRLWIELLKNAYYKNPDPKNPDASLSPSGGGAEGGGGFSSSKKLEELETLPNIDINIKCGNSLISRFALDADLNKALKKSKYSIEAYQSAVHTYQHAQSKEQKRQMEKLIADIKSDFQSEINANSKEVKQLYKTEGEITKMLTQQQMFEMGKREKATFNREVKKLQAKAEKLRHTIEEIRNNAIYDNAFEWRFEFPEVLSDNGDFMGFDAIIGNPPYIRQEELKEIKPYLQEHYQTYAGTADMYVFFVERGLSIMRSHGQFIYILPNKWMRAGYGDKLRQYLQTWNIESIIDFGDLPVFEEATTYPCIMRIQKAANNHRFKSLEIKSLDFEESLDAHVQENAFEVDSRLLQPSGWTLTDVKVQKLLEKLRSKGKPLGEYVDGKIYRGVLTGLNEAFVIDQETRDRLIAEDPKSAEIIKPFLAGRDIKRYKQPESDKYVLFTRRGIDIEEYPAVLKHLEQFKSRLVPKPKGHKGKWKGRKPGPYEWYEIQDNIAYYREFYKSKILWPGITADINPFAFDQKGYFGNDNNQLIVTSDKALLGILNSQVSKFFISHVADFVRGGYIRLKISYVSTIPIPSDQEALKTNISNLVDQRLEGNEDVEAEIDRLVYELYGLSEEEIGVVEGKKL